MRIVRVIIGIILMVVGVAFWATGCDKGKEAQMYNSMELRGNAENSNNAGAAGFILGGAMTLGGFVIAVKPSKKKTVNVN